MCSCSLLMDEIVRLWRLVALNPYLSTPDSILRSTIDDERKGQQPSTTTKFAAESSAETYLRSYPGYKETYEMCLLGWSIVVTGGFRIVSEVPPCDVRSHVPNPEITEDYLAEDDENSFSSDIVEISGDANVGDVENTNLSCLTIAHSGNRTGASSTLEKEVWTVEGSSFANASPSHASTSAKKHSISYRCRETKRTLDSQQDVDPKAVELTESVCEASISVCFPLDILVENNSHHSTAFHVGLLIISLPRSAAASKFLEAKIFFFDTDLWNKMKAMTEALAKEEI
uniref:ZSWIM8 TPR repeats domain-containing protein n=1 Tax=Trichuris muris TaxID=70415 RepID=A0A5S6QCK8_TRIMR